MVCLGLALSGCDATKPVQGHWTAPVAEGGVVTLRFFPDARYELVPSVAGSPVVSGRYTVSDERLVLVQERPARTEGDRAPGFYFFARRGKTMELWVDRDPIRVRTANLAREWTWVGPAQD